jgi:hypothetical protein
MRRKLERKQIVQRVVMSREQLTVTRLNVPLVLMSRDKKTALGARMRLRIKSRWMLLTKQLLLLQKTMNFHRPPGGGSVPILRSWNLPRPVARIVFLSTNRE